MKKLYERTQQKSGLKVGDIVKIGSTNTYDINRHPSQWPITWIDDMYAYIGDTRKITRIDKIGIKLKGAEDWWFPYFVLTKVKDKVNLPDKIKINQSNGYYIHFTSSGIIVGCQTISFDLLEQVYLKAKKVHNRKHIK